MKASARAWIQGLVQIVPGLGCLVVFWWGVFLADFRGSWLDTEVMLIAGICAAAALGFPYLGTRFIGRTVPRWTALAFSGGFMGVAAMTVGSLFGEGNQWTIFAFWGGVALAVYGLAWIGGRLGLKKSGRL